MGGIDRVGNMLNNAHITFKNAFKVSSIDSLTKEQVNFISFSSIVKAFDKTFSSVCDTLLMTVFLFLIKVWSL